MTEPPPGQQHTSAIRAMEARDAPTVARVHVHTWQVAYRGQLPDDLLDGLSSELDGRTARWARFIAEAEPRGWSQLVATDDGEVVGFATFGASRDEPETERLGEVYAIYVDPSHWGHGHGRELFAAAVEGLVERGFSEATLWVLATNARARRFYERAGWHLDGGARTERLGDAELNEVRYRRTVLVLGSDLTAGAM